MREEKNGMHYYDASSMVMKIKKKRIMSEERCMDGE